MSLTYYVLEDLSKTSERVFKLLVKYTLRYGEKLESNPILLALGLTSSELIKFLNTNFLNIMPRSKTFTTITKHTETLEEYCNCILT